MTDDEIYHSGNMQNGFVMQGQLVSGAPDIYNSFGNSCMLTTGSLLEN